MKTQIVITDLTRMRRGRVCIAGYDKNKKCIRPVLPPPGIPETSLKRDDKLIIYPFALVEFDLLKPNPQPPHTEDIHYDPDSPHFIREVKSREEILAWSLFNDIASLFEQPVLTGPGFYVQDCQGPRSLGTIRPAQVQEAIYAPGEEEAWDYRLSFMDKSGAVFRLKITDLSWHYYCNSLRSQGLEPATIAEKMSEILENSKVYIRIGLARGWEKYPDRCYLQINAIYTFPDYLGGKTFDDFM